MFNSEQAQKKWSALLEHSDVAPIQDNYRKSVTAVLLENQEKAMKEQAAHSSFQLNESIQPTPTITGQQTAASMSKFDPTLIALVRRAMPSLIAYDVAGVQPMTGPTGLIFAMVPLYKTAKGIDTHEGGLTDIGVDTLAQGPTVPAHVQYGGDAEQDRDGAGTGTFGEAAPDLGKGYQTAVGEGLSGEYVDGSPGTQGFGTMGFKIDKATVTARTRALRAGYSMELAQDLKAVHGLDAETELANIMSTEILAEINREVIEEIRGQAVAHQIAGENTFDFTSSTDVLDARWGQEKFQALVYRIQQAQNKIGQDTRRGQGNFAIVSPNVGSALAASGNLNYSDAITSTGLSIDTVGNTFAGTLNGNLKVYVDPYRATDEVVVGYRGQNAFDAGLFYCPYVPLTMVKAVGEEDFQPRIAFKTRYGMISNPLASTDATTVNGLAGAGTNIYFRKFTVNDLA